MSIRFFATLETQSVKVNIERAQARELPSPPSLGRERGGRFI